MISFSDTILLFCAQAIKRAEKFIRLQNVRYICRKHCENQSAKNEKTLHTSRHYRPRRRRVFIVR